MISMETMLTVGKIVATHGLQGEVKVKSFSGEIEHFFQFERVELTIGGQQFQLEIENVRPQGRNILLKLKTIDSIGEASKIQGAELWVAREKAAPRKEDEYYIADLHGCNVTYKGEFRGTVTGVCSNAGNELLEIELPEGRKIFIPFLHRFVGDIDINEKLVEIIEDWFFS